MLAFSLHCAWCACLSSHILFSLFLPAGFVFGLFLFLFHHFCISFSMSSASCYPPSASSFSLPLPPPRLPPPIQATPPSKSLHWRPLFLRSIASLCPSLTIRSQVHFSFYYSHYIWGLQFRTCVPLVGVVRCTVTVSLPSPFSAPLKHVGVLGSLPPPLSFPLLLSFNRQFASAPFVAQNLHFRLFSASLLTLPRCFLLIPTAT